MGNVLLISTYDLGHQPFGLASPAAWLQAAGANVSCRDTAVQDLDDDLVARADLIAIYVPMHTATRLAARLIPRLRAVNPQAHICCYGLYAPLNEAYLQALGVNSLIGGEFETELVSLYKSLKIPIVQRESASTSRSRISLDKQDFLIPKRDILPPLIHYAQLILPDGRLYRAGYTEASRGCKHTCRHCPIVPIYNGRFRIVQPATVLADIRQQVHAGANHITFGDPDFFNGPGHALRIVTALHEEFPSLTYDVTIKIEHLLKHERHLQTLRQTGCLFITSAVEAVDDAILQQLKKGHSRADFVQVARRLRKLDLYLHPTFVAFTPWTTPATYLDMLSMIKELDLIEHVAPVQYAIRLLLPAGSHLLTLPDVQSLIGPFDQAGLFYPWRHPDPHVDQFYHQIVGIVRAFQAQEESRRHLFARIVNTILDSFPELKFAFSRETRGELASAPVPRLSESWY